MSVSVYFDIKTRRAADVSPELYKCKIASNVLSRKYCDWIHACSILEYLLLRGIRCFHNLVILLMKLISYEILMNRLISSR